MDKWTFYKDAMRHWRWNRVSANHRLVAASPQGYLHLKSCLANARRNGWSEDLPTVGL